MKARLLKKLRRKAKKNYYIIKLSGNQYIIPAYPCSKPYSDLYKAMNECDALRRDYIRKSLTKIGVKRHIKLY